MHDSPRPADSPDDRLAALSERLRAAQETADRLVREATAAAQRSAAEGAGAEGAGAGGAAGGGPGESAPGGAAGGDDPGPGGAAGAGRPPPRGYATPGAPPPGSTTAEVQALAALLELGRTLLPAELRAQIAELVRELLLLVRALVDWYLERVEDRRDRPVEVQDIPIS